VSPKVSLQGGAEKEQDKERADVGKIRRSKEIWEEEKGGRRKKTNDAPRHLAVGIERLSLRPALKEVSKFDADNYSLPKLDACIHYYH